MFKKELLKNKIFALMLIAVGVASVLIDMDATFLIFILMFAVPLFFAKENWIM